MTNYELNWITNSMSPTTLAGLIVDLEGLEKGISSEQNRLLVAAWQALRDNVGSDESLELVAKLEADAI